MGSVHANRAKPFLCTIDDCKYATYGNAPLQVHIRIVHKKEKNHKCEVCDFRSSTKGHLKEHVIYKHSGSKPLHCLKCDYRCLFQAQLTNHMRSVHGSRDKNHVCPIKACKFVTHTEELLQQHIKRKGGVQNHTETFNNNKCEYCGFKIANQEKLASHIRVKHLGVKPHQCPHCEYKSVTKQVMKTHIQRIHEVLVKNLVCTIDGCKHITHDKSLLKKHIERCQLRKKCSKCDFKTGDSRVLNKHVRLNH